MTRFGSYNIQDDRNGGLESVLYTMYQANIDLGVLQETKITEGIFYQKSPHFAVEDHQKHRLNVARFHLTLGGGRSWFVMGCYLAPDEASSIERVVGSICQCPQETALLVAGDFNANLVEPEGKVREEVIYAVVAMAGLEDMCRTLLLQNIPWAREGRPCIMQRKGREVQFWKYYILETDHRLLQNVSVRDPRQKKGHYMILG